MPRKSPVNPSVEALVGADIGEVIAGKPVGDFEPSGVDYAAHQTTFNRMRAHFAAQKRVTVRLQEDTTVQVNGYGFQIKGKTRVEVPEQVAQILEEAGRI